MPTTITRTSRFLLAFSLATLPALSALAITTNWTDSSGGSFTDSRNWDNGVPGSDDLAVFRRGNVAYTVTFIEPFPFPIGTAIHPEINRLIIGTNTVTFFSLLPSTLTMDDFALLGGDTIIGQTASDVAVLNMNLASLSTLYATLGLAAGANGTLNINTARTFNVTGTGAANDLIVGAGGSGAMILSGGSDTTVADDTVLGRDATGVGNVSISGVGTTWTSTGDLTVGGSGTGTLMVDAGAELIDAVGYIGNNAGSTGTATVTGTNTVWRNTNTLYVGYSGNGTLNLTTGGDVIAATNTYIGYNSGSVGTANVSTNGGTLSRFVQNGELFIGHSGTGTFNVTGQGYAQNTNAYIGQNASGDGTVTVSGVDSEWNILGTLTIGNSGKAKLNVSAGGVVKNPTAIIANPAGSTGEVLVEGMGSSWINRGDLHIGKAGDGTLNISAGGQVFSESASAYLGSQSSATGTATVSGSGSRWQFNGFGGKIYVGDAGDGRLEVVNGGSVIGGLGYLGDDIDSVGFVSVSGTDSEWRTGAINVGLHGTGTIDVSEGGTVQGSVELATERNGVGTINVSGAGSRLSGQAATVGSFGHGILNITDGAGALFFSGTHIGANGDAVGEITVDGAGSSFNAGEVFKVGVNTGTGTLYVTRGAHAASGNTDIGSSAAANGMVTVSGNGSVWDMTVDVDLNVAHSGRGELDVIDGGFVRCRNGVIGRNSGSNGAANVDGAGSRWTLVNTLTVASAGNGSLTVTNGGVVDAAAIVVGPLGEVSGNGQLTANIQNAGEILGDLTIVGNVENAGLTSPGNSVGTLAIEGDFVQTMAGKLHIELASNLSYDQLRITGDAQLGGTLEVVTIGNFTPAVGTQFTFLTATDPDMSGDISEEFDDLLFPSIPNLAFNVIYNTQSVVLTVSSVGVPGDYNGNGTVDAADYVVWRKYDGTQEGYDSWRTNFGRTGDSGSGTRHLAAGDSPAADFTVPEPCALILVYSALAVGLPCCRRRFKRFC